MGSGPQFPANARDQENGKETKRRLLCVTTRSASCHSSLKDLWSPNDTMQCSFTHSFVKLTFAR